MFGPPILLQREFNPLQNLSNELLNFWSFDHDQHSRDEMRRLKPSRRTVLNLSIEDLHLDFPDSVRKEKHENYLFKLKNGLFKKSQERQKFNFLLSENRISRFGGRIIEELGSCDSINSECMEKSVLERRGERKGGMAIGFNWRLPRAVRVSLPRDEATAAR